MLLKTDCLTGDHELKSNSS